MTKRHLIILVLLLVIISIVVSPSINAQKNFFQETVDNVVEFFSNLFKNKQPPPEITPGITSPVDTNKKNVKPIESVIDTSRGIWISPDEIMALPISEGAWNVMWNAANSLVATNADISDQDSGHDVQTMAAALVCVRTGEFCTKAKDAVLAAIGTENADLNDPTISPAANQWLAVGRNLGAYVISADLLDLRASNGAEGLQVQNWIQSFIGRVSSQGVVFGAFGSGSNAGAQVGFAYATVAAYLNDPDEISYVWNRFQIFTGAINEGPDDIDISKGITYNWAHNNDPRFALPINPKDSTKVVPTGYPGAGTVHSIDGAVINDQRRGDYYQWPPVYTHYPWTGLEGSVPAAIILERLGFPAFDSANKALLRAVEYQWWLGQEMGQDPLCTGSCWWDYDRSIDVKYLINWRYGTSYPGRLPVGIGRTVGFTDWTHQGTVGVCGNNIVESGEQCDGTALNGQDCSSFGYNSGTLLCSGSCTFDKSSCVDSQNPTVTVTHSPASPITGELITITANANDNVGLSSIIINVDGSTANTCPVSGKTNSCVHTVTYSVAGNYNYFATVTDSSSHIGQDPSTGTKPLVVSPAPTGSTCEDSDLGDDPFNYGTVTITGTIPSISKDSCNLDQLTEYYCSTPSSSSASSKPYPCEFGCITNPVTSEGKCQQDNIAPVITSGPLVSSITENSALIEWETDESSTSVVDYGLTTSYGQQSNVPGLTDLHSVQLNGLQHSSVYFYRVTSADIAGNQVQGTGSFTTLTPEPSQNPIQFTFPTPENNAVLHEIEEGIKLSLGFSQPSDIKEFNINMNGITYKLPTLLSCSFENSVNCDNGETGTSLGTAFQTGKFGQGILVDNVPTPSSGDRLYWPSSGNMNLDEGTVMFWFKPSDVWDSSDPEYMLFDTRNTATPFNGIRVLKLKTSANILTQLVIAGTGNDITFSAADPNYFKQQDWNHYALVYGNGQMEVFMNGVSVGSNTYTGTIQTFSSNIYLGQRSNSFGTNYYSTANSVFDEFKIYAKKLTVNEISNIRDKEFGAYYLRFETLNDGTYTYSAVVKTIDGSTLNSEKRTFKVETDVTPIERDRKGILGSPVSNFFKLIITLLILIVIAKLLLEGEILGNLRKKKKVKKRKN